MNTMRVVLPVCDKDYRLMLANLEWQHELDGVKPYECVLCADGQLPPCSISALELAAGRAYAKIQTFVYPSAPNPKWPHGPNWAFQHVARHMQDGQRPWFWMEADCTPLKKGWLDRWNAEYHLRKKPIMGVVVPGQGHCNGTAVYPANFPTLSPRAMGSLEIAWDVVMFRETAFHTHNAADLLCHVWGIRDGKPEAFAGEPAYFASEKEVEAWVSPGAILFHRAKNTSLIERLREHENRHPDRKLPERPAIPRTEPAHDC